MILNGGHHCEWCNQPAKWVYPSDESTVVVTFKADGATVEVEGPADGWHACDICSSYIERGYWRAILKRSARYYGDRHGQDPITRQEILHATLTLLDIFHQARRGERVRL